MFKRSSVIALGIVAGLSVVACGGGGGGGSTVSPGTTVKPSPAASGGSSSQSAAVAPASFSILIPSSTSSSSSTHRSKKSIAGNTQSAVFTLINSSATGATLNSPSPAYSLTPTSSGCSAVSGGLLCVISVNAVVGTDVYDVDTYSSTDAAAGTKVGSGAFSIVVKANQSNTASLTLNGAVSSVILLSTVPSSGGYAALTLSGTGSTGNVYAIALDNKGETILSPDTYSAPITLSLVPISSDGGDAVARRGASGFRRPAGATNPAFFGQVTVTYASIDGAAVTSATASNTNGVSSVPIYSPEDTITVGTTSADAYSDYYGDIEEYIGIFAGVSGSTETPAPYYYDLPSNQLAIGIIPLPEPPSSPLPSPSPFGSPSPSPSPPASTIAFTGLSLNTPVPSPSPPPMSISTQPDPTVVGLGPSVNTYPSNVVSGSLDLENFTAASGQYYNTVSVYLSDTYTGSSPSLSASSACASPLYFMGLPVSASQVGTGNGVAVYRFSFLDTLAAGEQVSIPPCTITIVDGLESQAVLEVYQNQNTLTVDKKSRKK